MKPELEQVILPSISSPPTNINLLTYDIYLIDIHKMVKYGDVKCVKKNMYEQGLNYICISYRHGKEETQEWEANTPDYVAYINTFRKDDLKTLCECIRREPDLKHITYLWIDAISIDQKNKEKKYETIQQKESIFEFATSILAVPDLHWYYLRTKNQLQDHCITHLWKYAKHIYQEINYGKKRKNCTNNNNNNKRMDHHIHWDDLNYQLMITWIYLYLDPHVHSTFQLSSLFNQLPLIEQDLLPILQLDDDFASFYKLLKNTLTIMTKSTTTTTTTDDDQQHQFNNGNYYNKDKDWYRQFYYENYYFPLKPTNSPSNHNQQQWSIYYDSIGQQMNLDFNNIDHLKKQLFQWKKKWEQCQQDLKDAIQFLHNITDEWLNRTWVMSEYHIAKKKNKPIKLVYLSLLWNLRYEKDEHYYSFFNLFNNNNDQSIKTTFLTQVEKKLSFDRDYLDIILNSNTSQPMDRFISILPLWDKYKHIIQFNNYTLLDDWSSSITTMESVRVKLYELLDVDDKLRLLHACSYGIKVYPSFSSGYQEQWLFTNLLDQDEFQKIKGLYFIPELEITIIHNENENHGSNKYEITNQQDNNNSNKDVSSTSLSKSSSNNSPPSLTTTVITTKEKETINLISSSSKSNHPLIKNITSIELGSDNDQLKIECDNYYEVEYYHHPSGKRYPKNKFNAEFIIIPLYHQNHQQVNNNKDKDNKKKYGRCFIPLWRKHSESLWEVYRMDSLYYSTGHYYFFKMSIGVLNNGLKNDGCFIIK